MLESINNSVFEYKKLTKDEMEKRGILGRLVGTIADFTNPTRNQRLYSEELWDKAFDSPIMKEKIENRCCLGELGHPTDRSETDIEKVAICLAEVPKKNKGVLQGVFDILDTPNGRILKTLCDYGCKIGVSSRGEGDTYVDFDGQESVDPDTYVLETWDAVLVPAVKSARPTYVTESLQKPTLSLTESLNKLVEESNDSDKKVMIETLNNLNLNEGYQYKDYNITITQSGASLRDKSGKFIKEFPTEKEAEEYVDSLVESLNESDNLSSYGFVSDDKYVEFAEVSELLSGILSDYDKAIDNIEDSAITDDDKEALETNPKYKLLIDTYNNNYETINELERIIKDGSLQVDNNSTDDKIQLNMGLYTVDDLYNLLSNLTEILNNSSINESLLKEDSNEDIISKVEEEFGTVDEPFKGITFIMPDGKFLDLRNSYHHSDVEKFLIDNNLSNKQFSPNTGSETLTSLGAIRCDTTKYYMQLSDDVQPTGMQYQSILRWLDFCSRYLKSIEVYNQDGSESTLYNFTESIPDDILNKIRRYYSSGKLYEAKEINQKMQHNFKYGRSKSKSINEEIILDDKKESSEEDVDIDVTLEKDEGVVDPSDILEQLQASLLENKRLTDTISKLQEKVSVCNAKDEKNESIILKQKQSINKLTESVKSSLALRKEIISLNKLNEDLKNQLSQCNKEINRLNESISRIKSEKISLNKSKSLYEKEISKEVSKLQESIKSYKLNENKYVDTIEGLKKDLLQKQNEYKLKLNQKEKLVEQYKRKSAFIVDKYIELQASTLGIESSDIKNRLNENYSFKDIDKICEEYKSYTVNMNSLPFDASVNMKVKNPFKQNLVPIAEDEIDDQLLRMSGLK